MAVHLTAHREGFAPGLTQVTQLDESQDPTGIGFEVHKLRAGEKLSETTTVETAWLLMTGAIDVELGGKTHRYTRASLFDELPSCVHVSAGTAVTITCVEDTEIDIFRTQNEASFEPALYAPADVRDEHRGKGQVKDTCYRFVRTIFDRTNSDPAAQLVLGEVITMPGRWSSYPPHHHAQPEIYHYRFSEPQGYGHAELGETVLKVRQHDTVKILELNDHAQAAAPGYGMYYSWVIRHLPDNPYDVPEFTEEHQWIMKPGAESWWPDNVE